ncbi:MAG: DUF167 family protein [Chromatiaceae bacterium]|jgi:uncharacterized protein|nr:DUF167 family protein [Chromatiaceae bacterium]
MRDDDTWYRWRDGVLILNVRVQPRAKTDALIGPEGGHLRVRIAAPPIEGKANERLRRFLAGEFGVPQSRVELVAGGQARLKRIRIQAPRRLPDLIEPA